MLVRGQHWVYSATAFQLVFWDWVVSHWTWGSLIRLGGLLNKFQGSFYAHPSMLGLQACATTLSSLCRYWSSDGSSGLYSRHLTDKAVSQPQPFLSFRQHTSSWSESTNLQLIYNFLMTHQYNLRPPHLQAGPLKWPSLSPLLGYKQEKVETLWLLCSIFGSVMSTLSSISGCLQSSQELPAPPWGRGTSTSAANAVPACDLSWDFPHSHLCTRKDSAGVSCWER